MAVTAFTTVTHLQQFKVNEMNDKVKDKCNNNIQRFNKTVTLTYYSRTSMARTPLGP